MMQGISIFLQTLSKIYWLSANRLAKYRRVVYRGFSQYVVALLPIHLVVTAVLLVGCEDTTPAKDRTDMKKGTVRIQSFPSGARITLDEEDTERDTPASFELNPGFHTVRLTREGMQPWGPQSVEVAAGETTRLSVTLSPQVADTPVRQPRFGATGLLALPPDVPQTTYVIRADSVPDPLPRSVDQSSDFPAPGSQRGQGSCTSWAVAYAVKTYHERVERGWQLQDSRGRQFRERIMSPAYIHNQAKRPGKDGVYIEDALLLVARQGVSSLALTRYNHLDEETQPSAAARAEAARYKIADFGRVYRGNRRADFEREMKLHLVAGTPIIIGLWLYDDFALNDDNPVYDDDTSTYERSYHAVVIIGYDDDMNAFIILNSWGDDWGVSLNSGGRRGYGYLDYEWIDELINVAFVMIDAGTVSPDRLPTPATNPRPEDDAIGVETNTTLVWTPDGHATSFDVYVGLQPELGALEYLETTAATGFPVTLSRGTTYYWRIDSRNDAGLVLGSVWSFATAGDSPALPGPPKGPSPRDGASGVALDVDLNWESGGFTTSYDVYMGFFRDDVGVGFNLAGDKLVERLETVRRTTYDPGPLRPGTRYYWRIDAVQSTFYGKRTTAGPVWSFTTLGGMLTIADATVLEGSTAEFVVTMSPAARETVTVSYATRGRSATEGADYEATSGNLIFERGQTTRTIRVAAKFDYESDPNETFTVTLRRPSPSSIVLVDGTAVGRIIDVERDPIPDLVIEKARVDTGDTEVEAGELLRFYVTVRNLGTERSASTIVRYYRSSDATIENDDTQVNSARIAGIDPNQSTAEIVRETRAPSAVGTYYYGACVDAVIGESDTGNNCSTGARIVVEPSVTRPDLVVEPPPLNYAPMTAGASFNFSPTVRNQGSGRSNSTTLRYFRSSDSTITTSDTQQGTDRVSGLSAGSSSSEDIDVAAPSTAGTYYYGACVDAVAGESDTNNNCSSATRIVVEPQATARPDLVVEPPPLNYAPMTAGASFNFSPTVRNQGSGRSNSTTLRYFRSSDSTITTSDTQQGTDRVSGLSAGSSSSEDIDVAAPSTAGTYYYGACVDAVAGESDTNNNCSSATRIVVEPATPDLMLVSPRVDNYGSTLHTRETFRFQVTVRNQGTTGSVPSRLRYYRSVDSTITTSDREIGSDSVPVIFGGGTATEEMNPIAPSTAGTYYFGACVDPVSGESDTNNNCLAAVRVTVAARPDLVVEPPPQSYAPVTVGASFSFSPTVRNQGSGQSISTILRYYRSSDSTITSSDTQVGTDRIQSLSAGSTSSKDIDLTAPFTAGTYYYGACVDWVDGESNTNNNCSAGTRIVVNPADQDDGDTRASATWLTGQSGASQSWSLTRTLTAGDRDYFKFVYDSGRGQLEANTTGSLDTFGTIYFGNGDVADTDDDNGAGDNFEVSYDFAIGTYYIEVKGSDNSQIGSYQLTVEWDEDDAPDALPNRDWYGSSDEEHPDYLSAGDVDYFRTTISSCGFLSATTYLSNGLVGTFDSIDTVGTLYSSSGNELDTDDDDGDDSHFSMRTKLQRGTYYVRVTPYDSYQIGPYTLHLDFESSNCVGTVN